MWWDAVLFIRRDKEMQFYNILKRDSDTTHFYAYNRASYGILYAT